MPWEATTPVIERKQFIKSYLAGFSDIKDLCERYGVSRVTGHKWIRRFTEEGPAGLEDRSRRPLRSPNRTDPRVVELLLETKRQHRFWGPRKIIPYLSKRHPGLELPAASTAGAIFADAGLTRPQRRTTKHPHPGVPLGRATEPNDRWTADFKGDFNLRNGARVWPLTIADQFSRKILECKGLPSTKGGPVRAAFERVFYEYGLPHSIQTDNGTPFVSRAICGLSLLNVWWMRLGIHRERSRPGCPQDNGTHERMHRTLKDAACLPPRGNMRAQQRAFNAFVREFNEERPHEALDYDTPDSRYERSPREYTGVLPPQKYPGHFEVKNVTKAGEIRLGYQIVFLSHALADNLVGLEEVEDGIWHVYLNQFPIAVINERDYPASS